MTSSNPYAALGALAGLAASALVTVYKVRRLERDFDRRWKEFEADRDDSRVVVRLQGDIPIEVDYVPKSEGSNLVVVWLC